MIPAYRVFVLSVLLHPFSLYSHPGDPSGGISGRVLDRQTKAPVAHANVVLENTTRGDATDQQGAFFIPNLAPGFYTLVVRHQGYSLLKKKIRVDADRITKIILWLEPAVIPAEELVVTASRSEEFEQNIPQMVSIATAEEIRSRPGIQTPEALREEAGVFLQKTSQGGGSPILRGLKANKVLLLVDGIRMNNATYRGGNLQYLNTIDPFAIARIEVVHGPVSTLYGSDALGGVVHILTREPHLSNKGRLEWRGSLSGSYATAEQSGHVSLSLDLGGSVFGLLANMTYRSFGDIRRGSRGGDLLMHRLRNDSRTPRKLPLVQSPQAYQSYDGLIKAKFQPTSSFDVTASYQLGRQPRVPRYDVYEVMKNSLWYYQPQERDLAYLRFRYRSSGSWFNQLLTVLSYNRQYERRVRQKTGRKALTRDAFETKTLGLQVQFNKIFSDKHFIVYGLEIYQDRIASQSEKENPETSFVTPRAPLFPDGSAALNFGLFAQAELILHPLWKIDVGARLSRFYLKAPFDASTPAGREFGTIEQRNSTLTGTLGSRVRLSETVSWVANIAQGFRAPNLDDISKLGPGKGDSFYDIPNPRLQPEKGLSVDTGLKVSNAYVSSNLSLYYSRLSWLMVRRPALYRGLPYVVEGGDTLAVFRKENIGRAYIAGISLNAAAVVSEHWRLRGHFSYTYGQDLTHNEPLPSMPPFNGLIGMKYESTSWWMEMVVRFATEQRRLALEDRQDLRIPEGGTPGWWTLSARANLRVSSAFTVRLGLSNILDRNYREHLSGFNAPGRSFWIDTEITF